MSRNTIAKINLASLKRNYQLANEWAPSSQNMAIIKANAYGHGLVEIAKALHQQVPAFGVAIFDEAIKLRESGISKPILILQGIHTTAELIRASQLDLWVTIHNLEQLDLILANRLESSIRIWLKLDTGMHRLGLNQNQLDKAIDAIKNCQWVDDDFVVSSHFSCASELGHSESEKQIQMFVQMIAKASLSKQPSMSLANSPAIVALPQSNLDWNRPGILLYGLPLFDKPHATDQQLEPVMTFETEVVGLRHVDKGHCVGYGRTWKADRPSTIATLSVGYGDGYPRQAKSGTPVFIRDKRAKLAGIVSMDLISIDVTDIEGVTVGDRVELWGANLCANEVASYAGTIGYDLVTGVSQRVNRVYLTS
jgi:alanine racemase